LTGPGFSDTLVLALKIHPSTRRVFYIAGASDPALRESIREQLHAVAGHVELDDITVASLTRLLAEVKAVPPGSLILYVRYSQDDAGNVRFPLEIAPLIVQAATVPVYGVAESYLGSGVVGGVVTSLGGLGARIAEITQQILDGRRPQEIPIEHVPLTPTFDWRQLRRWGISERSLPPHSIVLFREVSAWELYKVPIVVALAILMLQSVLIVGLVFEHRRRRRAEMDSRRNLAAMAHMDRRAAMGELATSLAHELNQPLNAILQNAGVAQMLMTSHTVPTELAEMTDIISDIRKDDLRASEVIRRMRGLLQKHELETRPVDLNDVANETIAIVRPDARARGIELDADLADGAGPVLGDRIHLQQVLLNLLINAMDAVAGGPADRRRVRVETRRTNGEVRLAVEDTGRGIPGDRLTQVFEPFYTTKREGTGMGMGLAIARSIVEAHGGRMTAENNAHGGATVWFSVPVS
jgi:signal transduction histidine kinase